MGVTAVQLDAIFAGENNPHPQPSPNLVEGEVFRGPPQMTAYFWAFSIH